MAKLILVAGGSASGKTTVAKKVASNFSLESVKIISMDDYYKAHDELTYDQRALINYDHPDAFDFELLIKDLKELLSKKRIQKPVYDFTVHNRSQEIETTGPHDVIILEGLFAIENKELNELADLKIFVDTDSDIRLIRRMLRDIKERARTLESVIDQYITTVKPMYEAFIEPTKRNADIIIPWKDYNNIAVDLVITKLMAMLGK